MAYKPMTPYATPLILLKPIQTRDNTQPTYGVAAKQYPAIANGELIYGTFRTFTGTETTANGVYSVEDTALVETWYRPDITADCRIAVADTGAVYDIVGTPEDIEMRHQWLKFRLIRVKGGA